MCHAIPCLATTQSEGSQPSSSSFILPRLLGKDHFPSHSNRTQTIVQVRVEYSAEVGETWWKLPRSRAPLPTHASSQCASQLTHLSFMYLIYISHTHASHSRNPYSCTSFHHDVGLHSVMVRTEARVRCTGRGGEGELC